MKVGSIVKYYINSHQYIEGVVVEECKDGTVWVEYSNGQQMRHERNELVEVGK